MCGRYGLTLTTRQRELLGLSEQGPVDFAPGDEAVVLIGAGEGKLRECKMRWGFPSSQGRRLLINARCETASTLPTFARAVEQRRCLIPADGFYEWRKSGHTVEKKWIRLETRDRLYMAGLYGYFEVQSDPCFVILTQDANVQMHSVHDRMPMILPARREQMVWINDGRAALELLSNPPQIGIRIQGTYDQLSWLDID